MKRFFFLLAFLNLLNFGFKAQTQNPVKWAVTYKSISATEGEVLITATLEKNWHTYSQRKNEAIPIPTSFKFTPNKSYSLVGTTEETNAHEVFEKAFDAKVYVFEDKAEFKQKIKLKASKAFTLNFSVEYLCCNEMMCLPPKTENLSVQIK
jgi:hypothetical protein